MAIDSFDDDNDGETQDDGGTDGDDDDDDDVDVFLFSQAGTESVHVHAPNLAGGPGPLCHTSRRPWATLPHPTNSDQGRQHVLFSSSHVRTHVSSLSGVCMSTRKSGDRVAHLFAAVSQTRTFHDGASRKPGLA